MKRQVQGPSLWSIIGSVVVAALCFGQLNRGQAQQVFNWTNGSGSFAWTNSANWSPAASYPGKLTLTDTAIFPAGSPTGTINISSPITLGNMSFANSAAGNTVTGSTVSLSNGGSIVMNNINNQSINDVISAPVALLGSGTIQNDNFSNYSFWTGRLSITGSLSGAGALTVASTNGGLVELAGNNSAFTGTVNVTTTTPNAGGFFGSSLNGASRITFTNGVWEGYGAVTVPITVNSGATTFTNFSGGYTTNTMTINSGGTLTLGTGGGNSSAYYGTVSGPGTVILAGNGAGTAPDNYFLGATPNNLTGVVNLPSGKLNIGKTAGINAIGTACVNVGSVGNTAMVTWLANNQINGTSAFTLLSAGDLSVGGGTLGSGQLWLNGYSDTIAGLQDTGGSGSAIVENNASLTTSSLIISPSAGSTYNYGGRIRDASSPGLGTVSLSLSGAGRQILSGPVTYSGATTVNAGTLTLNGSISNANIQVNTGTFNGSGLVSFQPGNEIVVGSTGKFDASSGSWNLAALSASPITLLDFSSGGSFASPSSGSLNSLLTPASAAKYSLSIVNNSIVATLLPNNLWVADADGTWSSTGNWLNGIVPNGAAAPAKFGDAITTARTVTVNIPVTLGSMIFNNYNQYTLQASGNNGITLNNSGEDAVVAVNAGSHLINSALIALAGNGALDITVAPQGSFLTLAGNITEAASGTGIVNIAAATAGTVVLSGTNTFTGGLNIAGGAVTASGGFALASTVPVTVLQGASFGLGSETDNQTIGSLNCQGGNTVIYPNGGTLNVAANGSNTINGLVGSGVVILTASSAGVTQSLTNNGAFNGSLIINNGFINTPLGGTSAFGLSSNTVTINNATWNGIGGTGVSFHFTGTADTFGNYGGYPYFSGNFSIDPGTLFTWSTGNGNPGSLAGAISGGGTLAVHGAGSFIAGELNLSGALANTFSGTTIVEQGNLSLQKTAGVNAIAGPLTIGLNNMPAHVSLAANEQINPAVVVSFSNSASDLRLNGFSETVGGLTSNSGNGSIGNFGTSASTLTVATVGNTTYGGSLVNGGSGSLSLVVSGSGSLLLTGLGSFSGDTLVSSGSLVIMNAAALPSGANVTVGDPTAFQMQSAVVGNVSQDAAVAAVPEPGTLTLIAAGLLYFITSCLRRRSRQRIENV